MPTLSALFQKNRFEQIEDALAQNNVRRVRELAMAVRAEYVPVHDGFRDAVALTLGYLARRYGLETGETVGRICVERLMAGGDPPQYSQSGLRDRVKSIAFGWHWHVTRLTVTEDDAKISFQLHPCGSGMRLIQEGNYQPGPFGPPDAGAGRDHRLTRAVKPTWANFMSEGFPIYCNHCSEMTHMGLKTGSATFLVEGWTPLRAEGICAQHTFKDVAYVPATFYEHADLPVPPAVTPPSNRLFTPEELLDIQTHPLDKLVDCAEQGNTDGARAALDECLSGWRDSIHDVYRNWAAMLWNEVRIQLGEDAFADAVRATAPDLLAHMRGADAAGWAAFWSLHLRLCSVGEAADGVAFVVGEESLLQPNVLPHGAGWFVDRLNEGLAERGWSDMGQFSASDGNLIHRMRA